MYDRVATSDHSRTASRYDGCMHHVEEILVPTSGSGLHEFTSRVVDIVHATGIVCGCCTVFVRHTSASLVIQENADPSARRDMENWLNRLAPEGDALYTHVEEGPDDMPAHIKSLLTDVSLSIPVLDGRLALGTWQGIYLWEHRRARSSRAVVVSISGDPAA
ncbi:MAG: secondary thiamine-phosphate synthase enzyme YjbQ [Phycisphaerales bacterium]|nr:secondary thiamine-phosphate synthase enzyme YjbQ [Phycisphaerales bacterium]